MIYKIKATNKHNGEIIEFDLEGNAVEGFCYFDEELKEATHLQEVRDNKIREVNNNIILHNSPIYTISSGETAVIDSMSFEILIKAE
ncbi:hypothetical protein [Methanobrevibacter oralis]|uniref:hypothetical protein n=1 Tax=Methanobrevibacter oralis TaxID=66851 RepID=UPI001C732B60|nr:hypothetical protein [Methanobrevibacter oralis]